MEQLVVLIVLIIVTGIFLILFCNNKHPILCLLLASIGIVVAAIFQEKYSFFCIIMGVWFIVAPVCINEIESRLKKR